MKVYIDVDGCVLRGLDAKRLKDYFVLNSCALCSSPDEADYIVYVPCAVDKQNAEFCSNKIIELSHLKSTIIAVGCLPAILPHDTSLAKPNVHSLSTYEIEKIDTFFPEFTIKFENTPLSFETLTETPLEYINRKYKHDNADIRKLYKGIRVFGKLKFFEFHKKTIDKKTAFLVTSKGCNNHCSYCGIKKAVGKLKSVSLDEIKRLYAVLISEKYEHIIFYSDDTGSYGVDSGDNFQNLLFSLNQISGLKTTWDLYFINPKWLIQYEWAISSLVKSGRIISLECPVQHFSQKILNKMNRKYSIDIAMQKLLALKKASPMLYLSTHVIVGFPGEDENDIKEIEKQLKTRIFDYVELLIFYDNPVSPSFLMHNKISDNEKTERALRIHSLLSRLKIMHSLNPPTLLKNQKVDTKFLLNRNMFE